MSDQLVLPPAVTPFVSFPELLRENGFAVAPDQTIGFIEAIGVLGPGGISDIRAAAHALLAPPPERRAEFDALFNAHFIGQTLAAPAPGEAEDDDILIGDDGGQQLPPESDDDSLSGGERAGGERLAVRRFADIDDHTALRRFHRLAGQQLPRRKSYRRSPARRGISVNFRKAMRQAVQRDGEVIELPRLMRKLRLRRIVLLIDVSGSMKQQTDGYLRFAHALALIAKNCEVFTIGTRLTRVTSAMRIKNRGQALEAVSGTVADWDGGTRLGDALEAFLAVPRYAGFLRGAAVIILSDGLERGDHAAMTLAVEQISRLAWKTVWLTPLATDQDFQPQTEALQSVLPYIDMLSAGSSITQLCNRVLAIAKEAA